MSFDLQAVSTTLVHNITRNVINRVIGEKQSLIFDNFHLHGGDNRRCGFLLGKNFITMKSIKECRELQAIKMPIHPTLVERADNWYCQYQNLQQDSAVMLQLLLKQAAAVEGPTDFINYIPDAAIKFLPSEFRGVTKFISESDLSALDTPEAMRFKQLRRKVLFYAADDLLG